MPETFESLLVKLSRAKVDYLVAGGVAVCLNEDFTVDIFTVMRSRSFSDFQAMARNLKVGDVVIRYLAPESLIELKSLSTREKDRLDVGALRQIIAGAAPPDAPDLVELTPPRDVSAEESR